MDKSRILRRIAASSGLVAALLYFVGDIVADVPTISPFVDSESIARGFVANNTKTLIGAYLIMLSGFLFIWFIAYLRHKLRNQKQGSLLSLDVAYGGGLATVAMLLLSAHFIQSSTLVQDYGADSSAAKALLILNYNWYLLVEAPALAAFVLGISLTGWTTGKLPKWINLWGAANGVLLLLPVIPGSGIILSMFWIGVVSILLLRNEFDQDA